MSVNGFTFGDDPTIQKYNYESLDNKPNLSLKADLTVVQAGDATLQGEIDDLESAINNYVGVLTERTNNLFNKYDPDIKEIIVNNVQVNPNPNARTVVIPITVTDQTSVTVTRTVMSERFSVAKLATYPVIGAASSGSLADNSARSITISVDSTIKYIAIYFWLSTADTKTPTEILDGLMVEFGNSFTEYSEPFQIANQEQLETLEGAVTIPSSEDVTLNFVSATGYYNKNKGFATYSGVTSAKISVSEGEQYLLDSRSYYDAAIACLLDSSDVVQSTVWISNDTAQQRNVLITIPTGISSLLIQRLYNYKPTILRKVTGIKAKPVQSILNGKRITIIGDSITELNLRANTNWALWINEWANATIQNLGKSGTGFIAGGTNNYASRIASISNPDIIGVACSFNDMSNTVADLTTAAETFFDDLIATYPTTPIICYVQSPWSTYHYGVTASDAWVDALREICNTRGIPFYDGMYKGTVLKPWIAANRAVYYINDGYGNTGEEDWVHPNSEGHKAIARYLYPKFVENLVATGLDYLV